MKKKPVIKKNSIIKKVSLLKNIPARDVSLLNRITELIEQSKYQATVQVNSTLTLLFWKIGNSINEHVLKQKRADYGKQIVVTLSRHLSKKYGNNFEEKNLRRMLQFASQFNDLNNVVTVSRQLSWSHILLILPLKNGKSKLFYANKTVSEQWSVRELRKNIEIKSFERTTIADLQLQKSKPLKADGIFKDPYFFNFLGLKDSYLETDLEQAILRELESFIMEIGKGFSFIERQKRMIIDGDDYYLDLLFYHRSLKRLVAIELKIGKFRAKYKGQMELYLKWLNKNERKAGEEMPIGLILCAESSKEQIELLEMHKDGIMVAEYWTELPPKKELERKLQQVISETKERLEIKKLV